MSVATPIQSTQPKTAAPEVIVSTSPATGRTLGEVRVNSEQEVIAAVERARRAQAAWFEQGLDRRIAVIRDLKHAMYRNIDLIVNTLVAEQGKPQVEALTEFWPSIEQVAYYTRVARRTLASKRVMVPLVPHRVHRIEYQPYGVVAVFAPWNFPLILSVAPVVAALLAGNAVVYKPSEFATQLGSVLAQVMVEAGVPRDIFQIVQGAGDVGAALVRARPDKIVFTGSTATARRIAVAAGENLTPMTLELGGNDAAIVLEDANLDRAAAGLAWSAMLNAGQACLSVERIYVRREIHDAFVDKLAKIVNDEIRVGPGDAPATTMGSITTEAQLKIIDSQVHEAVSQGARVVTGGHVVEDRAGRFYMPTIITNVTANMRVVTDETFGPVVVVMPVASDEEAIRLANDTTFGLTGSVWTGDTRRGLAVARRLRVGHASVNDHVISASTPNLPWGGVGDSGYGRTRGREGLLDMAQTHVVSVQRGFTLPREIFWYPYTPFKHKLMRRAVDFLYASSWRDKLRALLP